MNAIIIIIIVVVSIIIYHNAPITLRPQHNITNSYKGKKAEMEIKNKT